GWLDSRHSFSFGDYHDAERMGFGALRVINEDRVAAGGGFPTHGHRDMEILTWVLDGALAHRDSLGSGAVIRPGELQAMRAGTGIRHSEFNASADETVHFLQIWIAPERHGLTPGYAQRAFADDELDGRLRLLASPDGRDGSLPIAQDAMLWAGRTPAAGGTLSYQPAAGRRAWLQVARGVVRLGEAGLHAGDAAAFEAGSVGADGIRIEADGAAEVLLFDLA
ncbi:MAG TPA: pirin family protein, partial [Rhodospirillales bacterium]|nr:pirin family protein [Rhodospirillales bacterium]